MWLRTASCVLSWFLLMSIVLTCNTDHYKYAVAQFLLEASGKALGDLLLTLELSDEAFSWAPLHRSSGLPGVPGTHLLPHTPPPIWSSRTAFHPRFLGCELGAGHCSLGPLSPSCSLGWVPIAPRTGSCHRHSLTRVLGMQPAL